MATVKVQCPACGVVIDVDDTNGAAICSSCAAPFAIARGIDAYEHSAHGRMLEQGLKSGEAFLQLKEWRKAYDVFSELSGKYPHDARTWLGIARAISHEQECHEINESMLDAIRQNVSRARTINLYIADNSWDVYIEREEARLEYEFNYRDSMRKKLQREYDDVVARSARQLSIMVANKRAMRSTYMMLGFALIVVCGIMIGAQKMGYLAHVWYLYIAGAVGIIGVLLFILGLASSTKRVYLPGSDVKDINRTVERIQQSAKRSGVEIDMSQPVKTSMLSRK
jgi:hypothetical protein